MYQTYESICLWAENVPSAYQSQTLNSDENDTFSFEGVVSNQESRAGWFSGDSDPISGGLGRWRFLCPSGSCPSSHTCALCSFCKIFLTLLLGLGLIVKVEAEDLCATIGNAAEEVAHPKDVDGSPLLKQEPITPVLSYAPMVLDIPPRQYVFVSQTEIEAGQQIGTKRKWPSLSSESVALGHDVTFDEVRMVIKSLQTGLVPLLT
jgi:hypothetical protein